MWPLPFDVADGLWSYIDLLANALLEKIQTNKVTPKERALMILKDGMERAIEGIWASIIGSKIIPSAVNRLKEFRTMEGTALEEFALKELSGLIFNVSLLGVKSEIAEFFFESMSDAFTDIFERVFKGGLEWKAKLLFGQESLDDDEIKDVLSTGLFGPKFASYISVASGLFNSAIYSEVITGLSYARDRQMNHIQNSVLFHIISVNDAWDWRFEWQLEEIQDSLKEAFRNATSDILRQMKNILTEIEVAIANINQAIWLLESVENIDEDVKNAVNTLIQESHDNLQTYYEIMKGIIQNFMTVVEEFDNYYKQFVMNRYAQYRAKIYRQLLDALEYSLDELEQYADEVLALINRIRGSNLSRGNKLVIDPV